MSIPCPPAKENPNRGEKKAGTARKRLAIAFLLPVVSGALLLAAHGAGAGQPNPVDHPSVSKSSAPAESSARSPSAQTDYPYKGGVTRQGSVVIISREFADAVRKKNSIVLSKVAIKGRLDKDGRLWGYEAVQIDKGSVVEQMGFKPHDLLTSINAIPVRDLEAKRDSLESADRFDLTIIRKGKTRKLRFEIR